MKSVTILVLATLVAVAFGSQIGSQVWAQSPDAQEVSAPDAGSGKFRNIRGSISGRFGASSNGACSSGVQGFAKQCPSGHTCSCTAIEGGKFDSSVIGPGSANTFITIDTSAGFGLPSTQLTSECFPAMVEIDLIAKHDTENLEATGALCSAKNESQLGGAFAVAASSPIDPLVASGF